MKRVTASNKPTDICLSGRSIAMKIIKIKSYLLLLVALCFSTSAFGQLVTVSTNYSVSQAVPDNDQSGLSITKNLSSPLFVTNILDLNVNLQITGDFNGDLYAYVTHSSGFSVLLNRAGRTASNPDGYGDDGFNIRLDDQAGPATGTGTRDVHNYRLTLSPPGGGQLTGTWLPDGRNVNPLNTLDTDARTALLSSFNGLDPNGSWTLFIADLSPGGNSTLVSWGLEVTVPEPGTFGLMALGGLVMFYFARRRTKKA
jgi:subtilisin-like proprotein convertase family protein